MRLINLVLLVFLLSIQIYLAQNRDNAEFTVWIKNNPDQEEICIYYKSIGIHWDNGGNITSSYYGGISDCPIHHSDIRRDFYYITSYTDPLFGRGLYFFEARDENNNSLQQLYIDWRTTEIPPPNGGSPDIDFDYDVKNNSFKFDDKFIPNTSYFGAWDLKDNMDCTTAGLLQFWQNCLVMVNKNNHPYLIWGAHPTITANSYKLYRSVTSNYSGKYVLIATTNSNTFDFIDNNTSYSLTNPIYYYVKAYNGSYSEKTNIVSTAISKIPKISDDLFGKDIINFNLYQNYPNPFNPTTQISYQIPENEFVTLKVYNSLGQEIRILVNEYQSSGYYNIKFDGSELSSGIYFYKLQAGEYISVKKMLLAK